MTPKKRIRRKHPRYLTCKYCQDPLSLFKLDANGCETYQHRSDRMYCSTKCRINAHLSRKEEEARLEKAKEESKPKPSYKYKGPNINLLSWEKPTE